MSRTVWNRYFLGLALITSLMLLVWIAGINAGAQTSASGEWTANLSTDNNSKINLSFQRRSKKGHKNETGNPYEFSELQGLSREQALSGGPVSFSLVREAGRIDCEGTFQNGKGSGTFRFTSNAAFVSAMKSRGFDFEPRSDGDGDDTDHWENKLFVATTLNITPALADDLKSAGFDLQTEDLFKAAIFNINSAFMREMKASGFNNLGMEELVKARIFKINADFVRQVSQMGFDKEPFESLVKMQIFKVTPEFITEVRNEGLNNLVVEDIVKLRIFKIDADFIRKAKSEGVPVEVESLVQRRIGFARR